MSKRHRKKNSPARPAARRPASPVYACAAKLHRAGNIQEAGELYEQVLLEDPNCVPALQVAGVMAFQRGEYDRSEDLFRRVIQLDMRNAEAHNNLGNVLRRQGKIGEAIQRFHAALELNPILANAHGNLGSALVCRGKLKEAISHLQRAIELKPDLAQAYIDLVSPLAFLGKFDDAAASFRRAAELQPQLVAIQAADVYAHLGTAFATFGLEEEAVECLDRSLEFGSSDSDRGRRLYQAYNTLGLSCQHNGRLSEAMAWFGKAIALDPRDTTAHSNMFWCMQYSDACDAEVATRRAAEWGRSFAPADSFCEPEVRDCDRLRIGYLSPDFRDHPVSYCIESLLESQNDARFEVFLYSNALEHDHVSNRLKRLAAQWREIAELSDEDASDLIRADGIDILVDLAGHSEHNRIGVLARKPAAIQACWLGYVATTGLAQMDYIIVNRRLLPPEEEHLYVEKPMRIMGDAFSFKPPSVNLPVTPLPALKNGYVTFGCHNYLAKVTSSVVGLWSEVLKAVQGSRFVMNRHAFVHPGVRDHFARLFAENGIDEERLTFISTSTRDEYLASLGDLDVLLDTFPFNGATSIYEALWMGLPVVTMSARRMVGHFGEGILDVLGRPEWAARTNEEYVAKACALAGDLTSLAEIRRALRKEFTASPLCNAPAFAREMEDAFLRMHAEKLAQRRERAVA